MTEGIFVKEKIPLTLPKAKLELLLTFFKSPIIVINITSSD